MDADLDSLCTAVCVTADDLLPQAAPNARRELNDAEVVTLAVAQVVMGIPSDRRFLAVARRRLDHLFPRLPTQPAYHKRRQGLREAIDWLAGVFAARSPGFHDDLVLLDSTPVECGRSLETVRRSRLSECCGYGWSRSHSRCGCTCAAPWMARPAEPSLGSRPEGARGGARAAAAHAARGRDRGLRQGLCRAGL